VRSVRRGLTAVTTALLLSACGNGSSSPSADHDARPSASPPHVSASSPESPEPSPSESLLGTPEHPVAAAAGRDLLDWKPVPGSSKDLVTVGDGWTLTVPEGAASAVLRGSTPMTIRAGDHAAITDAFLDDTHALVVTEDRLAEAPDRAVLVDLATGRRITLDGRSQPPTVVGGTWALGPESLVHATSGAGHRYCLATVDLADGSGTTGWCAEPRHGFSRASVTGDATTMMTFDDHHPSCRTLTEVEGTDLTPLPGVTDCKGWDSAVLDSSTVWSVVPKDRRIEAAHFYARTARGWFDLGPGTSGSLVTCAGSAYFTRDPSSRKDPALLMRWEPGSDRLSVVYASAGTGNAFLSPPRCGGRHLTVTAYSQAGDEQVTTRLG
jgi:hypothetical protein